MFNRLCLVRLHLVMREEIGVARDRLTHRTRSGKMRRFADAALHRAKLRRGGNLTERRNA